MPMNLLATKNYYLRVNGWYLSNDHLGYVSMVTLGSHDRASFKLVCNGEDATVSVLLLRQKKFLHFNGACFVFSANKVSSGRNEKFELYMLPPAANEMHSRPGVMRARLRSLATEAFLHFASPKESCRPAWITKAKSEEAASVIHFEPEC